MPKCNWKVVFLALNWALVACSSSHQTPTPVLTSGQSVVRQSPYNTLRVSQYKNLRSLRFLPGSSIQSVYDLEKPDRLVVSYTRVAMLGLACHPSPQRMLLVGLGGGSMAKFIHRRLPLAQLDCVELDPEVVQLAQEYFDVKGEAGLKLIVEDGRKFIEESSQLYDLIFLDAYDERSVPLSLASVEFLRLVSGRLSPKGLVVANLWGPSVNPNYPNMLATYREVFPELHIVQALPSPNQILLAFPQQRKLTKAALMELAGGLKGAGDLKKAVDSGYQPVAAGGTPLHDPPKKI